MSERRRGAVGGDVLHPVKLFSNDRDDLEAPVKIKACKLVASLCSVM